MKTLAMIVAFALAGCAVNERTDTPAAAGAPSEEPSAAGYAGGASSVGASGAPDTLGGAGGAGGSVGEPAAAGAAGEGGAPAEPAPGATCPAYGPVEAIGFGDPPTHTLTVTFKEGTADVAALDLRPFAGHAVTLTADGVELPGPVQGGSVWYAIGGSITAHEIVIELVEYSADQLMPAGGLRVWCVAP